MLSKDGLFRPKQVVNKFLYIFNEHRTLIAMGAVFLPIAVYHHGTNKCKVQLHGLEPPETSTV